MMRTAVSERTPNAYKNIRRDCLLIIVIMWCTPTVTRLRYNLFKALTFNLLRSSCTLRTLIDHRQIESIKFIGWYPLCTEPMSIPTHSNQNLRAPFVWLYFKLRKQYSNDRVLLFTRCALIHSYSNISLMHWEISFYEQNIVQITQTHIFLYAGKVIEVNRKKTHFQKVELIIISVTIY